MKFCKTGFLCLTVAVALLLCVFALPETAQAASKVTFEFRGNEAGDGAILKRVYGDPSG